MTACPRCGATGRTISAVTLGAQVVPSRLAGLASREGWRLCTGPACDVVYFQGDAIIERGAVLAAPFHKSAAADRTVCFCFGHTVAAVVADAGEPGASRVRGAIVEACRAGRDDCERLNPQGRCCLGNFDAVWREARAGSAPSESAREPPAGVCEPSPEPASARSEGQVIVAEDGRAAEVPADADEGRGDADEPEVTGHRHTPVLHHGVQREP